MSPGGRPEDRQSTTGPSRRPTAGRRCGSSWATGPPPTVSRWRPRPSLTGWPGNGMWTTPFIKTAPDKYLLFFKAGQADAITACFSEYSKRRAESAPSPQTRPHPGADQGGRRMKRPASPPKSRNAQRRRCMRTGSVKKYVIPNIPYLFVLWACLKLGTAYRLAAGADFAP